MSSSFKLLIIIAFFCFEGVFAQDSLRTVVANNGDGIFSILRSNGLDPIKTYKEFIELNKKNIKGDSELYKGRTYFIPEIKRDTLEQKQPVKDSIVQLKNTKPDSKIVKYSILGADHESVTIKDNMLKGTVYYLISGHGGPDPGAIGKYNGKLIAEDEYAYDVTLRLAKELISHGALVYLIIKDLNDGIRDEKVLEMDKDEVNYPNRTIPLNQMARLKQRVESVNNLYSKNKGKYQRLIVIHVDSRSKGENIDVFFYHHKNSKNGQRLAKSIHETFKKKYNKYQPNRNYSGSFSYRNLYLVNTTLPAMAFIEIGNIQNKKDQKRIVVPENRQALAKWISEGAILDFKQKN